MTPRVGTRLGSGHDAAVAIVALAFGLAIGWLDSRPGWDSTGITVVSIALVAAISGWSAPRRWWLTGLLVGAWVPLLEVTTAGNVASLAALVIAFLAAGVAAFARR